MEKISKEIPSPEEATEEKLPEDLSMDSEKKLGKEEDTEKVTQEAHKIEKPSVEGSEESDTEKRLQQAMEVRITEANEMIADLTKKLEGRDLNSVTEESVANANKLEDKRDALQGQIDAGEISPIEYTRGIAPTVEALAKIIEGWERTTKGQMLEDSKE